SSPGDGAGTGPMVLAATRPVRLNLGTQTRIWPFGRPASTRMWVHLGKPTIACPSGPINRVSRWLPIHTASALCGSACTIVAVLSPARAAPAPASLMKPRRDSPWYDIALVLVWVTSCYGVYSGSNTSVARAVTQAG